MKVRSGKLLILLAVFLWLLLSVFHLYWAELNQDEGWYLYAAGLVAHGELPYRDFAFTQGPVMAFVYALATPLVEHFGVAAGRVVTQVFGGMAMLLCVGLAMAGSPRRGRQTAAVFAVSLLAVNTYHSQFLSVVKTYSLTSLWLMAAFLFLALALTRHRPFASLMAGFFLAAAACTRLSAGVLIPVTVLGCLLDPTLRPCRAGWGVALGAGLGLLLFLGPCLLLAPEATWFHLVEFHRAREGGGLVYKAGFVSRFVGAYLVICVATVVAGFAGCGKSRTSSVRNSLCRLMVIGFFGLSLVHIAAPFPYDDYQVMAVPLLVAAVSAVGATKLLSFSEGGEGDARTSRVATGVAWLLLLASVATAGSSPLLQESLVDGPDRIWWRIRKHSPLVALQDMGTQLQDNIPEGSTLLTQDLYLAVEANRRVPRGLEMGPFCYYPEWTDEQATRCHVLNRAGMSALILSAESPVAAVSGYGFSIQAPDIVPIPDQQREVLIDLLTTGYELHNSIEAFGQAQTQLDIYRRRTTSGKSIAPAVGVP